MVYGHCTSLIVSVSATPCIGIVEVWLGVDIVAHPNTEILHPTVRHVHWELVGEGWKAQEC